MSVTFDAVGPSSAGHGGASSPISWTHTGSASATALLVGVIVDATNDSGASVAVTFKGNSLTQIGSNVHSDNLTTGFVAVFGIAGTNAAGTGTVSVTVTGGTGVDQIAGGSLSFLGTATTVAGAFGTLHSGFGSSGTQTVTVPGTVSGNLIGGFTCSGSPIGTASSPSTSRFVFANSTGTENAASSAGSTTPSTGSAVTVAWASNGDTWGVAAVEVQAPGSPVITTTTLLSAAQGQYYYEDLQAAGGAAPYTWSVSSGSLPSWASLNSSTGVITGTPTTLGATTFTVEVTDAVSSTDTQVLTLNTVTRDPLQQPFSATASPWNVPIGSGAVYVSVSLPSYPYSPSNFTTMPNIDDERIVLAPTAPVVSIQYSSAGWSGTSRCSPTTGGPAGLPINVPVPAGYTCPSDTQNDAAAFLQPDGRTISQCQPLALCTAGGNGTSIIAFADVDLYGDGITGSQGGSGLSAYGGAIRLGELRPGQTGMRHALKIVVDSNFVLAPQTTFANAFRWPAVTADSDWSSYGSTNATQYSGMKMGALLAIPASVNLTTLGLQGSPGMQLAWTLQNYGAYIVDSGGTGYGWALCAEGGAQGSMRDQFLADWGIPFFDRVNSNTSWTNDVQTCMLALQLVDNNSPTSIGGGGTPLQALAPDIFPPQSPTATASPAPSWRSRFKPTQKLSVPVFIPLQTSVFVPDTDASGTAVDGGETVTVLQGAGPTGGAALVSATWLTRWGRQRFPKPLPVFLPLSTATSPSDSDAVHGEDSGFLYPSDSDTPTGTDARETLHPRDTDASGRAAYLELTAWPLDAETAGTRQGGGESQYWTGPLADPVPDTGHGTDGPTPVTFLKFEAETVHGTDAGPGAGGTIEQIDVYTFQPPFRWTGGFFSLTLPATPVQAAEEIDEMREFTLWQGERPDGTALRLYAAFAAGRLHFVSDSDAAASREEGETASLQVTVHIAPALPVNLTVT